MHHKLLITLTTVWCLSMAGICRADLRSDTTALLAELRQQGVAARQPDQMKNIDATFALAEMYYQLNDRKSAERYYTLTQRNATALLRPAAITKPEQQSPAPSQQEPPQPPAQQQNHAVAGVTTDTQSADLVHQSPTPSTSDLQETPCCAKQLVGKSGSYTVAKGDTIRLVAAKLGISRTQLAAENNLQPNVMLKIGQRLRYNNLRIIPEPPLKDGIVVNIPDRMLYLFQEGAVTFSAAVALGTPTKTDQFIWQTPTGRFRVKYKAKDPTWIVPPSIQEEMKLAGKEVITSVAPGPTNPLGKFAISTTLPGILIHSTSKPWSIYSYASHGCIRVHPEQMETLFRLVWKNAPGEIIYRPVKLAASDDGRILLEVHNDIYKKSKDLGRIARELIQTKGLGDRVDWDKVRRVVTRRAGVAEEVSLRIAKSSADRPTSQAQSTSYSDGSVPLTKDSSEPLLPRDSLPLLGLTRTTETSSGASNP